MARKVKIVLPKMELQEIKIGEKTVKIDSYITLEKYEQILEDIKETILYNSDIIDKYGLLHARYMKDVLELCTNIDISSMSGEDFNSPFLRETLFNNIDNFYDIEGYLEKEYDKWVIENSFGILSQSIPNSQDMEKSMEKLAETINNLPSDKLELISKSIVWNNMPALGNQIAPATHNSVIGEA